MRPLYESATVWAGTRARIGHEGCGVSVRRELVANLVLRDQKMATASVARPTEKPSITFHHLDYRTKALFIETQNQD